MKSSERAALKGKDKPTEYSEPLYPGTSSIMAENCRVVIKNQTEGPAVDALVKHMLRQPEIK